MKLRLATPGVLVDIGARLRGDPAGIDAAGDEVRIGAP